ncbi:hypothetical protein D915_001008 [Fasciola hepatica]|uniref:Uncharacterized protein n=1 Tax=Fasciola hepatica TaxID=6192 RepID=A0A4E0RXN6_FASHE|nr:hypothetical protein D915_001008 [Fasciola hepatica]
MLFETVLMFITSVWALTINTNAVAEEPNHNTSNLITWPWNSSEKLFTLLPVDDIPLYQFVEYITNETEKRDPKVHNLHIRHFYFYTHIYLTSMFNLDRELSLVAVHDNQLLGANMVFSIEKLKLMYAPAEIGHVLDFVLPCYAAARPPISANPGTHALVSTLRASASVEVNKALIQETTNLIRTSTPIGSYHLIWENRGTMDDFLQLIGYELLFCGNQSMKSLCDWTKTGVPASVAETLCLFRWTNFGTVPL